MTDLVEVLKKQPCHKSQFFKVIYTVDSSHLGPTIKAPFCSLVKKGDQIEMTQVVFSPQLCQEILKVRFKDNARMPLFVMGYFKKEKMSEPSHRPVSLYWDPFTPVPFIHGMRSNGLEALHHDMVFHLITDSACLFRKEIIDLVSVTREKAVLVAEYLLDMNFTLSLYLNWKNCPEKQPIISLHDVYLAKSDLFDEEQNHFWYLVLADFIMVFYAKPNLGEPELGLNLFFRYFQKYEQGLRARGLTRESLHRFLEKIARICQEGACWNKDHVGCEAIQGLALVKELQPKEGVAASALTSLHVYSQD